MGGMKALVFGIAVVSALVPQAALALSGDVFLISPDDGLWTQKTNNTLGFSFNFTDPGYGMALCTLSVGGATFTGPTLKDAETEFKIPTDFPAGTITWNVSCENDTTIISGNRVIHVDRTPPAVILISPADAGTAESPVPFRFRYTDALSPEADCNLYTNGTFKGHVTAENNTQTQMDVAAADGQYSWFVNCTDPAGNSATSGTRHVSVYTPPTLSSVSIDSPEDSQDTTVVDVELTTNNPASWCGTSLDGEENITLDNSSGTSWYVTMYGIPEGEHRITAWCNDSHGLVSSEKTFTVVTTGLLITITSPENTTYWMASIIPVRASLSKNGQSCSMNVDSGSPIDMGSVSAKLWNYTIGGLDIGQHTVSVTCMTTTGIENTSEVSFTTSGKECESDTVGACTGSEECISGKCVGLECTGCKHAENHSCVSYECCSDFECPVSQRCDLNSCEDIECDCGVVKNHTCVEYECCSNFDCGQNEKCDLSAHRCDKNTILLMVQKSAMTGQPVEVSAVDNNGDPLEDVRITVTYESGESESLLTDSTGTATFTMKETGGVDISGDLSGYDGESLVMEGVPGFNWGVLLAVMIGLAAVAGAYFYWNTMAKSSPLSLKKSVSGENISLRVRNRGTEPAMNVFIMDTVPSGAFIGSDVMPGIEDIGNESHLTWTASLEPGEEIVITYRATSTSKGFFVRWGDDEYAG